tara:strand:- start:384 stop:530 length:147 start_codon:yes stop_codon:yes gene_type:complete
MIQHHGWRLEELESMLPWERDVYVQLLLRHVKEENERQKRENAKIRNM